MGRWRGGRNYHGGGEGEGERTGARAVFVAQIWYRTSVKAAIEYY
jgi:hypothetical protein